MSSCFLKINKISSADKTWRLKVQINKCREENKSGDVTSDTAERQRITRNYYKQLSAYKS